MELLVPNPHASLATLIVVFTIEEYGWATLHIHINDKENMIQLSNVFPPFWDILHWIKMIERGEMPVSVTIDEEGTEKVLSVELLGNNDILLFRLAQKYGSGYLSETLILRSVLVKAFYDAFKKMLDTGFNPDEWSDVGEGALDVKYINMADDEWFQRK